MYTFSLTFLGDVRILGHRTLHAEGEFVMTKSTRPTHYEILGVPFEASQEEIRLAYRRLAVTIHPDRPQNTGSAHLTVINAAYRILSDPSQRQAYDRTIRPIRTVADIFERTEFGSRLCKNMETGAVASARPGGDEVFRLQVRQVDGFLQVDIQLHEGEPNFSQRYDWPSSLYTWLRIPGRGAPGVRGGVAGDAWLFLQPKQGG